MLMRDVNSRADVPRVMTAAGGLVGTENEVDFLGKVGDADAGNPLSDRPVGIFRARYRLIQVRASQRFAQHRPKHQNNPSAGVYLPWRRPDDAPNQGPQIHILPPGFPYYSLLRTGHLTPSTAQGLSIICYARVTKYPIQDQAPIWTERRVGLR